MSEVIQTKNVAGYTINIVRDNNPISPRYDDNLGTMVCFHNRYDLGDKHKYNHKDYNNWDGLKRAIIRNENPCVILPIYMYDHSGITINTTGFSCPWDSGRIGFIFASKEKVRKEFGVKRIDSKLKTRVEEQLIGEVETYDQFLRGDVYGFEILDENDNHIDSGWGYYDEDECMVEAELNVPE